MISLVIGLNDRFHAGNSGGQQEKTLHKKLGIRFCPGICKLIVIQPRGYTKDVSQDGVWMALRDFFF